MTKPITLEPDYEAIAIEFQNKIEALEYALSERESDIDELKDRIEKFEAVIEYLEDKLGINNSI